MASSSGVKMNWNRGLFRFWIVLSVIWLLGVAVVGDVGDAFNTYWTFWSVRAESREAQADQAREETSATHHPGEYSLDEAAPPADTHQATLLQIAHRLGSADENLRFVLIVGLLPPFALLGLGASLLWALRGFRTA